MLFGVLLLLATSPMLLAEESIDSTENDLPCKNNTFTNEATSALDHIYNFPKCLDKEIIKYATELSQKSNRLDGKEALEKCIRPTELPEVTALRATCLNATRQVLKNDDNYRTTSMVCFSLRVPEPDSCKQAKQRSKDGIKQAAYNKDLLDRYNKALTACKSYFKNCFENYGRRDRCGY